MIARLTVVVAATAGAAFAQPLQYRIDRIGLYGPGYLNASGQHQHAARSMTPSGLILGFTNRFASSGTSLGSAAWMAQHGVTTRLGLTDGAHTSSTGVQISSAIGASATGAIAGSSTRFSGVGGSSAWLFENGAYTALGITDALHTDANGERSAAVQRINGAGDVVGASRQYVPADPGWTGTTAWVRRAGITTTLGLTNAEHTSPTGLRSSFAQEQSATGIVAGSSTRFGPAGELRGNTVWTNDGTETRIIGFNDALHTSPTGVRLHNLRTIAASGHVFGESASYPSAGGIGNSAWVASPAGVTTRIGLFDAEHTNPSSGRQYSEVIGANAQGAAIGRSTREDSPGSNGESAWLYNAGVTQRIGLYDANHTSSSGFQYSQAQFLGAGGHVLGQSTRFSPTLSGGLSTWVAHNGVTTRVGLFDTLHTDGNGFQTSEALGINALGDAIGTSARYTGPLISTSGWFYDSLANETVPLVFSTSLGNQATTNPTIVLDNRTVLGSYFDYSTNQTRAFWWTRTAGVFDVSNFVAGGLDNAGWDRLTSIFRATVPGSFDGTMIVGTGRATGIPGGSIFVLSSIPAPGALALGAVAIVSVARRRRHYHDA